MVSLILIMYSWKTEYFFLTLILLSPVILLTWLILHLVKKYAGDRFKGIFHYSLIITGTVAGLLFILYMTIVLTFQHQVNVQMGFNYGTPDTPEGELFVITRIDNGLPMNEAGLNEDDIIRTSAVSDLYTMIYKNQGKEIIVPIKRNGSDLNIPVKVPGFKSTFFLRVYGMLIDL